MDGKHYTERRLGDQNYCHDFSDYRLGLDWESNLLNSYNS
jgi:hypothetical protein